MRSVSRVTGAGLVTLFALSLGCATPSRNVDTSTSTSSSDDAGSAQPEEASLAGSYQCRWHHGDRGLDLPCKIQRQGQSLSLSMIVEDAALQGSLTTTDFGFRLEGALRHAKGESQAAEETISADFFLQGEGAYATVLVLKDKSLVKLNLQRE